MSSPISDKAINELYQQRKHQVVAPEIDITNLTTAGSNRKFLGQKLSTIFAFSCIGSFSVFAIMSYLNQSLAPTEKNIQFVIHRDIQLEQDKEKKEDQPTIELAVINVIPEPPIATKLPTKKLLPSIVSNNDIVGESAVNEPLVTAIVEVNSQIPTSTLAIYLTKKVQPKYPVKAQQKKTQGEIRLSYQVNAQGSVESIKVINSSSKLFIKPAIKALSQWKFTKPALIAPQHNQSTYEVEFSFKLNDK